MVLGPIVRLVVESMALPEAFKEIVPRETDPSVNTTLPVGTCPLPDTVTANVTVWPWFMVVTDGVRAVDDAVEPVTFTETPLDVEPAMFAVPA